MWDFAAGCMRSYLILREKAARFHDRRGDPGRARGRDGRPRSPNRRRRRHRPDAIAALRRGPHDVGALAAQGYGNERLDQLVTELLLGVR